MKHKIIQTGEGLLLLDLEAEIQVSDWMAVYSTGIKGVGNGYHVSQYNNTTVSKLNRICKGTGKIIASSYIDELPKISQSIEEIRQMIDEKHMTDLAWDKFSKDGEMDVNGLMRSTGFYFGYKLNKALYTKEQMIEAMGKIFDLCQRYRTSDIFLDRQRLEILESFEPKIDCFVEIEDALISEDDTDHDEGGTLPGTVEIEIQYAITKIL